MMNFCVDVAIVIMDECVSNWVYVCVFVNEILHMCLMINLLTNLRHPPT